MNIIIKILSLSCTCVLLLLRRLLLFAFNKTFYRSFWSRRKKRTVSYRNAQPPIRFTVVVVVVVVVSFCRVCVLECCCCCCCCCCFVFFFFKIREFFSILFCFFSSQTTKYPLELLPPQSDFQGKKNFSPFSGSRTAEDNGTWFHGTTSTGGTAGTRNGRVIDFGVSATFDETSAFVDGLVPYGDIP